MEEKRGKDSVITCVSAARRFLEKALEGVGKNNASSYNQLTILLNHARRIENTLIVEDQLRNER